MCQRTEQVEDPCPCWAVPIDYGDVTTVALEHPLVRSSVAVVAGLGIGTPTVVTDSASVAVWGNRRVRGVDSVGSFPCSHTADA